MDPSEPAKPAVHVRDAVAEDAPAIVALHRAVLAEKAWFITLPGEPIGGIDARIRQVRDFKRLGNSAFLVAVHDGKVVGFLTAAGGSLARMRHCAKIEVMVAGDARGMGVGRALMSACVAWARGNPVVEKLGLNVFADNDRAIALYLAYGFAEEGRRLREYRAEDGTYRDDVLMYLLVGGSQG